MTSDGSKKAQFSAMKRQNPFIQLLTEGKKLRENQKQEQEPAEHEPELSETEYLEKLQEICMMNAQERKHLYEKYGRARSSLAKFTEQNNYQPKLPLPKKVETWIDFSQLFLNQSGRRSVNSDTFIINDLKMDNCNNNCIISDIDDDEDVEMLPAWKQSKSSKSGSISSKSSSSSGLIISEEEEEATNMLYIRKRRRSSGVFETLKNLICVGDK